MTQVLALVNQKGGCGKTSSTISLGAAFAKLGYRACIVDTDPQYSVGANWYPTRKLTLPSQYYYQQRSRDYDNTVDSAPNDGSRFNRYPAYLRANDSYTHDANIRHPL